MGGEKPYGLTVRAVIYNKEGQVLLLQRSLRSKNYPGKWEFPGGKVDPGEKFDVAVVREVKEETGLDGSIKRFIGAARAELPHVTAIQLVMELEAPGTPAISEEHEGLMWISPKEMLSLDLVDWVQAFVQKYMLS